MGANVPDRDDELAIEITDVDDGTGEEVPVSLHQAQQREHALRQRYFQSLLNSGTLRRLAVAAARKADIQAMERYFETKAKRQRVVNLLGSAPHGVLENIEAVMRIVDKALGDDIKPKPSERQLGLILREFGASYAAMFQSGTWPEMERYLAGTNRVFDHGDGIDRLTVVHEVAETALRELFHLLNPDAGDPPFMRKRKAA